MRNPDNPILEDTCLCAIVRNEEINPAGGIVRFCERHIPLFSNVELVDTGSVDRTPEILREMQRKFPWLRIHFERFKGYAGSRNSCLDKAREIEAKKVMVLDADERLTIEEAMIAAQKLTDYPDALGLEFEFFYIYTDGTSHQASGMNPRLFQLLPNTSFRSPNGRIDNEYPCLESVQLRCRLDVLHSRAKIRHFCPSREAFAEKALRVYGKRYLPNDGGWDILGDNLPRDENVGDIPSTKLSWKKLNPLSLDKEDLKTPYI